MFEIKTGMVRPFFFTAKQWLYIWIVSFTRKTGCWWNHVDIYHAHIVCLDTFYSEAQKHQQLQLQLELDRLHIDAIMTQDAGHG